MKRLVCAFLVLLPAAAQAEPAPAPPRVDVEASVGGGMLRAGPSESGGNTAVLGTVGVGGSYVTRRGLALLADVQVGHGSGECLADGLCRQAAWGKLARADVGLRWLFGPRRYAQGTALVVRTSHGRDEWMSTYHGAGAALALGWRRPLGPRSFVGLELRLFGWQAEHTDGDSELLVLGGGVGVTVGGAP